MTTPTTPHPKKTSLSMLVDSVNVTELFRKYQQQVCSSNLTFHIETDLQEVLALSDILFLARNEHSALKTQVFGLATLNSLCDHVLAKLDLLSLSTRMTGNKANVVEGIAKLLTKLPRNQVLNLDKVGEVELQTTYYDALLSEIIANQDRKVALR
ncbi:hypothetical protein DFQ28_007976 [Apophysomyces sp. BC1034]|nr:hypothetical protein DFQ30_007715 [Apophysomyces sp. BC1015]KAG0175943.1 hypothetical protein DFQ29_006747 [Apophysomyces sp. BC1021]KAG0186341.1 hypothetical protein DFQ28_007976 [Apophysomyces sp. BC1034]